MKVDLYTPGARQRLEEDTPSGGKLVCTQEELNHVATVDVPDFDSPPDVVTWGVRSFIRRPVSDKNYFYYVEGFAWHVPYQSKKETDG